MVYQKIGVGLRGKERGREEIKGRGRKDKGRRGVREMTGDDRSKGD